MFFLKAVVIFSVIKTVSNTVCPSAETICVINDENYVESTCNNLEMLREDCIKKLSKANCVNSNQLANDFFLKKMSSCPESSYQCLEAKINCERNATQPDNLAQICKHMEMVKMDCFRELSKSKCDDTRPWINDFLWNVIRPQCQEFFRKCSLAYDKCENSIQYEKLTWVCNNLEMLTKNCTEVLSEAKCASWKQWLDDQISRVKEHCPFKEELTPIFRCLSDRSAIISEKTIRCTKNPSSSTSYKSCEWQASRDCCPNACQLPTLLDKYYNTSEVIKICNSPANSCDESESRH